MNREIKFRCWDGKEMMIDVGVICLDEQRAIDYYNFHDGYAGEDISYGEGEKGILMQFTGWNDWFEGDILGFKDDKSKGVIVFADFAFRIKYKKWDDALPLPILDSFYKRNAIKLGNVYENPNLFKL